MCPYYFFFGPLVESINTVSNKCVRTVLLLWFDFYVFCLTSSIIQEGNVETVVKASEESALDQTSKAVIIAPAVEGAAVVKAPWGRKTSFASVSLV